jgi:hypothetical protein
LTSSGLPLRYSHVIFELRAVKAAAHRRQYPMEEEAMARGRCLCGAVTFEYEGAENWKAHCHCESCRRNTSSPFTTWFGVEKTVFKFIGQQPSIYISSPGARRMFCGTCGTPIAFEHDKYPNEIHLYAASLENSAEFTPQSHVHWAERVPWILLSDELPRYNHSSR